MKHKTIANKKFDYVFCGITTLAVSAAIKLQNIGYNCLIFDRMAMPGHEFSYALCADGEANPENIKSLETKKFLSILIQRNAINSNGRIHLPAITPILSSMLDGSGVVFYPHTVATELCRENDLWKLRLYSPGQCTVVNSKYVIDSTSDFQLGLFFGQRPKIEKCSLNAAVNPPSEYKGDGFTFDKHEIYRGCFDGEYYARFSFGSDMLSAREALFNYLTSTPNEIRDWQIISIATEFEIKTDEETYEITDGFIRSPSTLYSDAIGAFDAGIELTRQLTENCKEFVCKNIPLKMVNCKVDKTKYDIIVAGLGTAGAITAISAAHNKLRVLGLEQLTSLGGMGTAGAIGTRYLGFKGGSYEKINQDAKKLRENGFVNERDEGSTTKAFALETTAKTAGVEIKLCAVIYDVIMSPLQDKRIIGVRWIDNDGLHSAYSDYVVDSTADGQVCLMAGCEMLGGRDIDGSCQLFSNVCRIFNRENKTCGTHNQDDGTVNQYNPLELGVAVLHSSCSPLHLPERFHDGKTRRLGPAPWLGIREGLRIIGEETVTMPDIHNHNITKEPLFYEYSNLDNHGKDTAFEGRIFRDWVEICSLWDCRIAFPIPCGALIPKGYYGLIVAGRCISTDHEVAFAVRMKDAMQKCGEVVSEILTFAIKNNCDIRDVQYDELKQKLYIKGILNKIDCFRANYYCEDSAMSYKNDIYTLAQEPDKLQKMLCSNSGGAAILAAASSIDEYSSLLKVWVNDSNKYLSLNSALALCIGGYGKDAADVIINAITDKSGEQSKNSYTFNYPYAVSAISAAGRAELIEAIDSLLTIVANPHYADNIPLLNSFEGKTKLVVDNNDLRYLYFTTAIVALYEIYKAHPEQKKRISAVLRNIRLDDYQTAVSMIGHSDNVKLNSRHLIETLINKINN